MQSFYIDDVITILIMVVIAFIIPGTLTVWNIYNCVSKKPNHEESLLRHFLKISMKEIFHFKGIDDTDLI